MTTPDWQQASTRLRSGLQRRIGIDARALAAFRIAVGLLVIVDLLLRTREFRAHYTDAGVLPVVVLREQYPTLQRLSVHALSGEAWVQAALFGLAGACAALLVVGYRTRAATAASLYLLASLHVRNPYVLNGGDLLLQHLLFWSLLLPLGARWSVDARRVESSPERVITPASAGILVQVVLVYGVNAVLKFRHDAWPSGEAVYAAFGLDRFTVLLGPVVADAQGVLWVANYAWLGLLVSAPLLVLLTGRPRVVLVGAFAGAHLGMAATMQLGIFPLVSIVALVPFLPAGVWDRLARVERVQRPRTAAAALLARADGALPSRGVRRRPGWVDRWGGRLARTTAAAVLVGLVVFNAVGLGVVGVPPPAEDTLSGTPSDLRWVMFPAPPETDRLTVATGTLASGERVDVLNEGQLRLEHSEGAIGTYSSARTRKYASHLLTETALRPAFVAFLCDRWARTHEETLRAVAVYVVEAPARGPVGDGPDRRTLASGSCDTAG